MTTANNGTSIIRLIQVVGLIYTCSPSFCFPSYLSPGLFTFINGRVVVVVVVLQCMCLKNKEEKQKNATLLYYLSSVPFAFCPAFQLRSYQLRQLRVNPIRKSIPECGKRKEGIRIEQATRFLAQGSVVVDERFTVRGWCGVTRNIITRTTDRHEER